MLFGFRYIQFPHWVQRLRHSAVCVWFDHLEKFLHNYCKLSSRPQLGFIVRSPPSAQDSTDSPTDSLRDLLFKIFIIKFSVFFQCKSHSTHNPTGFSFSSSRHLEPDMASLHLNLSQLESWYALITHYTWILWIHVKCTLHCVIYWIKHERRKKRITRSKVKENLVTLKSYYFEYKKFSQISHTGRLKNKNKIKIFFLCVWMWISWYIKIVLIKKIFLQKLCHKLRKYYKNYI